jgi:hypothetical protein
MSNEAGAFDTVQCEVYQRENMQKVIEALLTDGDAENG